MEGKNSQADVVVGLDSSLIQNAKNTHLFTRNHINVNQLSIPGGWKNKIFLPFDYSYFAFVYDRNMLSNPPKSLKELVESHEPWKIIYQDPRLSAPGLGLVTWMQTVYGKNVEQAWRDLTKKTVTVTRDWGSAYNLFLRGESDLVLSYITSPLYHLLQEKNKDYAAAVFSEGHYIQVETAARLASSSHPRLAARFIRFLISDEVQAEVLTKNWMYPVVQINTPIKYKEVTIPNLSLKMTLKEIEANRLKWVNLWRDTVSL
jgi:thiamine transport system substrate-binding protein